MQNKRFFYKKKAQECASPGRVQFGRKKTLFGRKKTPFGRPKARFGRGCEEQMGRFFKKRRSITGQGAFDFGRFFLKRHLKKGRWRLQVYIYIYVPDPSVASQSICTQNHQQTPNHPVFTNINIADISCESFQLASIPTVWSNKDSSRQGQTTAVMFLS